MASRRETRVGSHGLDPHRVHLSALSGTWFTLVGARNLIAGGPTTTPEQEARKLIDEQLAEAGWFVQDYTALHIAAGPGVAVREFPLQSGFADYLLYVDGKAAGVIEAKPKGHSLTGVELQSSKYTLGLPGIVPHWFRPLPFAYESTGVVTQFTNGLDPEPCSREVFTFHRPEELRRLATAESQLRANLREIPELVPEGLWPPQIGAVENLDRSLAEGRSRSLIQMATGSGKTFTAVTACYRLIKFARAKRILFLVDRSNLGRQAMTEFQQYVGPYSGNSFTEEYVVQHLKGSSIDPASKVVITTIQRLYSILKGEEYDAENEEDSLFEVGNGLFHKEPLPVVYNPSVPIETFDFIVVDECHRSIYNVWRQVLDYFDAFLIGLTATPTAQTVGFFHKNLVQDYSHERAVADGVNVDFSVYRIRTKVTEEGATLEAEPGLFVPHMNRVTKEKRYKELDNDLTYTAGDLDRDVVSLDQIRLVARTFRDRLGTEVFPGRTEVPKTLIFAKTDDHAEDIVKIFREEFGKGNDFCQKITSKTTGKKPEELLNEFRNSYNPRIAVTVDMIATGTDVKPLECLLFMRNVNSATYFEQMKGRGVRIVNPDDLRSVTPDARHKTHFVIVDAVGVCERDKTESLPLDRKPSVPLDKILAMVATGVVDVDLVSTLAGRLARLEQEVGAEEAAEIAERAEGRDLSTLAQDLLASIDRDRTCTLAQEMYNLAEGEDPSEEQLTKAEQAAMTEALKPFLDPKLREAILTARASVDKVIDEVTKDELLEAGFDAQAKDRAASLVANFRAFLDEHKDEIEALQILYSQPYRAGLRFRQVKELAAALRKPPLSLLSHPEQALWQAYEQVEPDKVKGEAKALVDLVALVRHALDPGAPLVPVRETVEERYQAWLAEQEALDLKYSPAQRKWLDAIKDHIATALAITEDDFQEVPFSQMGGIGSAYQVFGDYLEPLLKELNERLAA